MFNLKSFLFSILILAMLPSANANDAGTYIRSYLGYTFASDVDAGDEIGATLNGVDVESDISTGVALGYEFANNFRMEFEVSRRSADLDGVTGDSPNANPMAPNN